MNTYIENEEIVKEVIFEFVSLYGSSNLWDEEIREIFDEVVEQRVKEKFKHKKFKAERGKN